MFLYGFFIFLAHSCPLTIPLGARYSFAAVWVAQGGAEVLQQAHECIYLQIRPFLLLCRDFTIGETATGWILGLISAFVLEVRPNGGGIDDDDDDDDGEDLGKRKKKKTYKNCVAV